MYISEVSIQNYKSFSDLYMLLNKDLSVIIGENNIGKSNFLDALSILFISNYGWKRLQLSNDDFFYQLIIQNNWPVIKIQVTISDICTDEEMALTCKWLNPASNLTPIKLIKIPVDQYEWII